jgi:hypothetical protein
MKGCSQNTRQPAKKDTRPARIERSTDSRNVSDPTVQQQPLRAMVDGTGVVEYSGSGDSAAVERQNG